MNFERICGYASLLGLFVTICGYFSSNHPIHICILSLTALLFIFITIISFKRYHIASCYLEGEAEIRELHNSLMLETQQIKKSSFEGIVADLTQRCSEISNAFEKIKDVKIGVCIKYVNGSIENPYVETLCRDTYSYNKRKNLYTTEEKDYLLQNTDFKHIFELVKEKRPYRSLYYCGNHLANKHQYINTHLIGELPSSILTYYKRRKMWPLPYKSTIVVPILYPDNMGASAFLCIDSPNSKGFDKKRDVVILQQIALFMSEIICFVCKEHLKI